MSYKMINKIKSDKLFREGYKKSHDCDLAEGLRLYDEAIALNPDDRWLPLHKSISLAKSGNYDDAIKLMKSEIREDESRHVYFLFLGIFYYDIKCFEDAQSAFNSTLKLCRDHGLAINYLNLINFISGVDRTASIRSIKDNIGSTDLQFLGKLLVECEVAIHAMGDVGSEFECFEKDTINCRISELECIIDSIVCHVRHAFSSTERDAAMNIIKARRDKASGHLREAIKSYEKSLKFNNSLIEPYEELIFLYASQMMTSEFHGLLKSKPGYVALSRIIEDDDDIESAYAEDDSVNTVKVIIYSAAKMCYMSGNYEKALRYFSVIAGLSCEYPVNYLCGLCCIRMNDKIKALEWFTKSDNIKKLKIVDNRLTKVIDNLGGNR